MTAVTHRWLYVKPGELARCDTCGLTYYARELDQVGNQHRCKDAERCKRYGAQLAERRRVRPGRRRAKGER